MQEWVSVNPAVLQPCFCLQAALGADLSHLCAALILRTLTQLQNMCIGKRKDPKVDFPGLYMSKMCYSGQIAECLGAFQSAH